MEHHDAGQTRQRFENLTKTPPRVKPSGGMYHENAVVDVADQMLQKRPPSTESQALSGVVEYQSTLGRSENHFTTETSTPLKSALETSQVANIKEQFSDDGSDTEIELELVGLFEDKAQRAFKNQDAEAQKKALIKKSQKLAKLATRKPKYRQMEKPNTLHILQLQRSLGKWSQAIDTALGVLSRADSISPDFELLCQGNLAYC